MFDNQLSVGELAIRAALVYLALLVMVRMSGKRTVGQFTPFDLLVLMLLSESVSNALTGGDEFVTGGLLLAAVLIGLNGLVGFISSRSRRLEHLIEGNPVLIGRDGTWYGDVIKKHRLGMADVEQALREADCSLRDMELAILDTDGNISIVQR